MTTDRDAAVETLRRQVHDLALAALVVLTGLLFVVTWAYAVGRVHGFSMAEASYGELSEAFDHYLTICQVAAEVVQDVDAELHLELSERPTGWEVDR